MQQNSRKGSWSSISVTVDDTDPRDPAASCDRCGAQGTVARALRSGPTRLVLRYCSACWPVVQPELEDRKQKEMEEWQEADRAWLELWERSPQGTLPAPPTQPIWTLASRTWYDVRSFLALLSQPPKGGPGPTSAQLAEVAAEILDTSPEMDGPIPPDVQEFIASHARVTEDEN